MTKAELKRLEDELSISLPEDYRRLMLNYPFASDSGVTEEELCNNVDILLDHNRNTDPSILGIDNYFIIGSDRSEEVYLIGLAEEPSPVYVFDLETGKTTPKVDTLEAWREEVAKYVKEMEADEAYLRRWRVNKKWWQFWR